MIWPIVGPLELVYTRLGPKKYVVWARGIDIPLLREFMPGANDNDLLKPSAIADAFWYFAHQDRSAWSHELDVRPFKEKF